MKKALAFVAMTFIGSGVTSGGTFVLNKLQTTDNKKIQETINQQFVENDKMTLEILRKLEKKIDLLERGKN
jgi:23S rRNA U2552 (ribose-2'-O)-methylase RlmE/FtsJ